MVGRIVKIAGMLVGYALYTAAVAGLLLWYLFPADTVRDWLLFRLHRATPGLEWKIGSLGLALPGRLVLADVRVGSRQRPATELIRLDRVSLGPDGMAMLRERRVRALLHVTLAAGGLDATLERPDPGRLEVQGRVRGVKLDGLKGVQARLGRRIDGTLSGTFGGGLVLADPLRIRGQADLLLEQGQLFFRKPVLGLDRLPFSRIGASLVLDRDRLKVEKGSVSSGLLSGDFHGIVTPGRDLADSGIRLQGAIRPRPELFARAGGGSTLSGLVRTRLREGALAFSVTGTLAEPGILFPALAGAAGGELPGEGRQ